MPFLNPPVLIPRKAIVMGKQSRTSKTRSSRTGRSNGYPPEVSTDQDNQAWLSMWRRDQIEFHQTEFSPHLLAHWPLRQSNQRSPRVLVPLCGKSLDMLWLSRHGFEVVGIELSSVAVSAFFDENGLACQRHQEGLFERWQGAGIQVYCGDYFEMTPERLGPIDLVYDHTSLTALDTAIRTRYVEHMRHLLSPSLCPVFIHTVEDSDETDQPTAYVSDIDPELAVLYQGHFTIELLISERLIDEPLPPGTQLASKLYRLTPRVNL